MKRIKQALIEARALIAYPPNWTTGALARDKNRADCSPHSPEAVCYCGSGALFKTGVTDPTVLFHALDAYDPKLTSQSIPGVNDRLGHEAVLALFDKAIAACDTVVVREDKYLKKP